MGKYQTRVDAGLDQVSGALTGDELLNELKAAMIEEAVFKTLFGNSGERIFVNKIPSYNDAIVPLVEFYWSEETYNNWDVRQPGTITGRFVLPAKLAGDFNSLRRIAAAFARFLGAGKHQMFQRVPGLIAFGRGINFRYDQLLQAAQAVFPAIPFTLPFNFDGKLFERLRPDIDLHDRLDAELIGWVETYGLIVKNEKGDVLIPEGTLVTTGQTNP